MPATSSDEQEDARETDNLSQEELPASENQIVTIDQLRAANINEIVGAGGPLEMHVILSIIETEIIEATEAGQSERSSALRQIGTTCTYTFDPSDIGQVYGPLGRVGNRRTPIPADISLDSQLAFRDFAFEVENPALRARLHDITWINNPKEHRSAIAAIESYNACVILIISGIEEEGKNDEIGHTWTAVDFLRRALNIGRRTGWKRPEVAHTKFLLQKIREIARDKAIEATFNRSFELDLEQKVSDAAILAQEAETRASKDWREKQFLSAQHRWRMAASAFHEAKLQPESHRCLIQLAECFVEEAGIHGANTFMKTHGLVKAIQSLRQVPKQFRPLGRLEQLQADLVAAQASVGDMMGTFEHTQDLTDLVNDTKLRLSGKTLSESLKLYASLDRHKPPEYYFARARKEAEEFPLSTLFESTLHDADGKMVASTSSLKAREGVDGHHLLSIARALSFEYGVVVQGLIEPARFTISQNYNIGTEKLIVFCRSSPFVPQGHENIFALGLARMFSGAYMEAAYLLVLQIENSLRHVLRQAGSDPTTIFPDMTQEDVGLSLLLDRFKPDLEAIYGRGMVFKLEMLLQNRAGPNLRNRLAHGTWSDGHFWTAECIYACWLVFQLLFAPLYPHWDEIGDQIFPEAEAKQTGEAKS